MAICQGPSLSLVDWNGLVADAERNVAQFHETKGVFFFLTETCALYYTLSKAPAITDNDQSVITND